MNYTTSIEVAPRMGSEDRKTLSDKNILYEYGVAPRMGSEDRNTEGVVQNTDGTMSLPAWGARIEISVRQAKSFLKRVAPRMGSEDRNAWKQDPRKKNSVAPRMGSEDRNTRNGRNPAYLKRRSPHGERG